MSTIRHNEDMFFSHSRIEEEAKKYNGFDWMEVYEALGIDIEPILAENIGVYENYAALHRDSNDNSKILALVDEENNRIYKCLRDKIDVCLREMPPWGEELSEQSQKVLLACRAFAWQIGHTSNHHTYCQSVWKGLSEVKNDYSFLDIYHVIFPYMWD